MKSLLTAVKGILLPFLLIQCASADLWNLPQSLNSRDMRVTFEVDSTWHLVKGVVKEIKGEVWLENKSDFRTIRAEVHFPIASFDTDSESRDERLREVMHQETTPDVVFKIVGSLKTDCSPDSLHDSKPCMLEIPGELSINKITKALVLQSQVRKLGSAYEISGTANFKWTEFDVEDPSILIAKLYEDVKVDFLLTLASK